jgi:hypothetical protein
MADEVGPPDDDRPTPAGHAAPLAGERSRRHDEMPPAADQDERSERRGPQRGPAEPSWPPRLAVAGALVLYLALPNAYAPGPRWLPVVLVGILMVPLVIANPVRLTRHSGGWRAVSIAAVAVINAFNIVSVVALVHGLLHHEKVDGRTLIVSAIEIWLTNVLVFALWFWELDGGGPVARREQLNRLPDFLFVQQASPDWASADWTPRFVDYLYLSFTNSTAFSPTDTMPLSAWAKVLMIGESLVALVTVAVVVSRAVGILT